MESKKTKPTNGQLQRRLERAVVHIDRDKSYQHVFFSDKGLRMEIVDDCCVLSTGFHSHIFSNITSSGISRPYLYTKRMIDIALTNDCKTDDGYSFTKLLEVLKSKEEQAEYNIAVYYEWWVFNCFQPLFSIGETEVEEFMLYESYVHNIARNAILLSEKTEDMTNRQFIDNLVSNMKDFMDAIDERVIFPKKTDEEMVRENIEAVQQQDLEQQKQ